MASNEDLYRELAEQEEDDDARYRQAQAMKELKKVPRKEPDAKKALQRFEDEIKPVLEARRRVEMGLPPTTNPLRNLVLKMTGKDQLVQPDVVEPSKGLILDGPSLEEVQKEIAANPDRYRHLQKKAPEVRPVQAQRKGPQDIHRA